MKKIRSMKKSQQKTQTEFGSKVQFTLNNFLNQNINFPKKNSTSEQFQQTGYMTSRPQTSKSRKKITSAQKEERKKKLQEQTSNSPVAEKNSKLERKNAFFEEAIFSIINQKMSHNGKRQYARDENIEIQANHHEEISLWLGQLYNKCASTAFSYFIKGDLSYRETKTFCCEQILKNMIMKMKSSKMKSLTEIKIMNEESGNILNHLCNKYPQTDTVDINKKIKNVISNMRINNWEDDEYDILKNCGVVFDLRQSQNYSSEIMKVLNYIITLPYIKYNESYTNFQFFEKFMTRIFRLVETRNSENDIQKVIDEEGNFKFHIPFKEKKSLREEEIEYMQKVQSYTKFSIGCKISENTTSYTSSDISSGILKIDNPSVARILDKWVDQLKAKFQDSQTHIMKRIYRFKGRINGKNKLQDKDKQVLCQIIEQKKKEVKKIFKQIRENIDELAFNLTTITDSDVQMLKYIPQNERYFGQFAVKMCEASNQYFLMILNKQIHLLLTTIENLKQKRLEEYQLVQSPFYRSLDISLITFKSGDLMRCKCCSKQDQIARILQVLKTLSEIWGSKLLKIIRVKDRLDSGTKDVLINVMFNDICPCEIQLSVISSSDEKQSYFDKFNHFLYEIKRAYLGPIMEMCEIWTHNEAKSKTFKKAIEQSNKKKKKQINPNLIDLKVVFENYKRYCFPFVCHFCKIFFSGQKWIFWNWKNKIKDNEVYCAECLNKCSNLENYRKQIIRFIFQEMIKKNKKFLKYTNYLIQIKTPQQLQNYHTFIYIPKYAINYNYFFVKKIILKNEKHAFVWTEFKNQYEYCEKICSFAYEYIIQKMNDYLFFSWNLPIQIVPIDFKARSEAELLRNYFPGLKKRSQTNNLKCSALKISQKEYYYLPIIYENDFDLSENISKQDNMTKVVEYLEQAKEIIQRNNSMIKNEFNSLHIGVKLKMNHTTKEIYLNYNQIEEINFISKMNSLKIFHANFNQIKEIPKINPSLQELSLMKNQIQKIQNFENAQSLKNLYLSSNKISKIENISHLKKIQCLFLGPNLIQKIENLPQSVFRLGLNFNKIKKIQNVDHILGIYSINLAGNKIEKIENLEKCPKLKTLLLNKNPIKKIENLQNLPSLEILHISNTQINSTSHQLTEETTHELQYLSSLIKIILNFNVIPSLQHLFKNTFQFQFLKELEMTNSKVEDFQNLSLTCPNIQVLNLSNNQITICNEIMKLQNLQELNLSYNNIKQLPKFGWQEFINIKKMNMSYNDLTYIPNLSLLFFLEEINFSHNKITVVEGIPFNDMEGTGINKIIDLSFNSLFTKEIPDAIIQGLECVGPDKKIDLRQNGGKEKLGIFWKFSQKLPKFYYQ